MLFVNKYRGKSMNKKNLLVKGAVVSIILLFVGMSIIPAAGSQIMEKTETLIDQRSSEPSSFIGSTIYVDDDNTEGPWDGTPEHPFQYIQDGVDAAVEGDTVFVFDGTYYGRIWVDEPIKVIGQSNKHTIILGDEEKWSGGIEIISNGVTICNFCIRDVNDGIHGNGNYVNISENRINATCSAIRLYSGLAGCNNVIISRNVITVDGYRDYAAIHLGATANNIISENTLVRYRVGIYLDQSWLNNHAVGNNTISKNSFLKGWIDARTRGNRFFNLEGESNPKNIWDGNYWKRPRNIPKPIFGTWTLSFEKLGMNRIPLVLANFDINPAQEPYEI